MGLFKKIKKAAGGIVGGLTGIGGADAAGKGSKAQTRYLKEGLAELDRSYQDQLGFLGPQQALGNNALNLYGGLLGVNTGANGGAGMPDYSSFFKSPGYQFQLEEGENAIGRMQSARGNLFSGGAGRELASFNSGLASQGYNDYANRLGAFANLGPQTNNLLAGYRGNLGSSKANLLAGIGDAKAAGYVGAANSYSNAAGNLLNFGSSFINPFSGGFGGAGPQSAGPVDLEWGAPGTPRAI